MATPRYGCQRFGGIVAVGRDPDYELWYQPKDESVSEHIFLVPEGRFDAVQVDVYAYIFRTIGALAPTRWEINEEGVRPTLQLKRTGWDKDSSRIIPFMPEINRTHRKVFDREDAGQNYTTASLRIKPKASTATTRKQNPKR